MPDKLLCKRCDVYVGFAAEGVAKRPVGRDDAWLASHCWICLRSGPEIAADQGVDRTAPLADRQTRTAPHGDPLALDPLGTPPQERFLGAFDPPPAEPAVRVSAMTVDGKPLGEWTTYEDGRHEPEPSKEVSTFVDKAMFDAEPERALDRPRVHLLSATPDPLGAVAAFAMMYEGRVIRDLSEITDEERRHYFDESFKTALKTPLEAIDLHFMVEGLTRASWDQMRTQRTAVFAGESLRFAVKPDLKESVRPGPLVSEAHRNRRRVWDEAIDTISEAYQYLIANGVPAEDARGLLPMNVLTRGHWKTNLRNLESEIGKRLCTQAQFEWRVIHADLRRAIREHQGVYRRGTGPDGRRSSPPSVINSGWQWQYIAESPMFVPICFQKGACMFKSGADRGCTIRERVDRGEFDKIRPEEWMADPTAAWVR
jgi:flavin-dependent thymidylate synthase